MILEKISITGLRGFAQQTTIGFAAPTGSPGSGLTLLTGPNNSGKSTIIEALKARTSSYQTPSFNVGMRNASTDSVSIEYTIDGKVDTLSSSRAGSSETKAEWLSDFSPYVVGSRRHFSPYFGKSSSTDRKSYILQSGSNLSFREQTLTGFEGRLFEIEKEHSNFNCLLKDVIPDFMDWSIDQNEGGQYFIKLKSSGKSHSLGGSGDGIVSVFVIIAALFDSKSGDTIAIDEPELSLHPSIQKRLADIIKFYAKDRQIILSTHSPYFVDPAALQNGAQIIRTWDRENYIEAYELSVRQCPDFRKLLSPNSNNPHVFGLDARNIFFSDDPILVFEGQEDVIFWPKVVSAYPRLINVSTYGWGAGGAANMINVIKVLKTLGYRKVAGILDNNRPDDLSKLRNIFPDYHFMEIPAPDIRSKPASSAKVAVEGLIDESGSVRKELKSELDSKLAVLEKFLT